MGTSNFARGNTSKVFAVLMDRKENFKECSECGEKHQDYEYNEENYKNLSVCCECGSDELEEKSEYVSPDEWEYDDLKSYIRETAQEEVKNLPYSYREEDGSGHERQYNPNDLFSFSISKSFGDIEVDLKIVAQIVGAYYEGASLDFEVSIYSGCEDWVIENSRDLDDVIDCLFDRNYNSNMSVGLQKIQSKNALKWAEKEIEQLKDLVEQVFTKVSMPLNVVGTFSNGETIYSKV